MASFNECYNSSTINSVTNVLAATSNIIGVIILITIAAVAAHRLTSDAKINLYLGILFFAAIICAFITLASSLVGFALCPVFGYHLYNAIAFNVSVPAIVVLMASLLVSLILRLYLTFIGTAWELSKSHLYLSMAAVLVFTMLAVTDIIIHHLGFINIVEYFGIMF